MPAPSSEIAVVDLTHAPEGSEKERQAAEAFTTASRQHGCAYVIDPECNEELIEQTLQQNRRLFDLPVEEKEKLKINQLLRGWQSEDVAEILDPGNQTRRDTKEGWYFGREIPADSPETRFPLHGPNVWPPEALLPGFRAATERWLGAQRALAQRLNRLLALGLGLPGAHFEPFFARPLVHLRSLRYTAQRSDPGAGVYGCGAHSDYGQVALLAADAPGLQVLLGGAWRDAPPRPGALVVLLGSLCHRWTNGALQAPRHRVVSVTGRPRHSLVYFFDPNFDAHIECLPTCCGGPDNPPRFPPILVSEHMLGLYAETHDPIPAKKEKD